MGKLKVRWFMFTCSGDNTVVFIELMNELHQEWMKKIDFVYATALKSKNEMKEMDVAFIEGAISSEQEAKKAKEIRKLAKVVVAVGACAVTGMPSGQRNSFSNEQMERIRPFLKLHRLNDKVEPISKFIKVDTEVPGCPMDEKTFLAVMQKYMDEFGVK